jgi:hypothetical protein
MSEEDPNANHPDNVKVVHEGWSSLQEKKRGLVNACTEEYWSSLRCVKD